MSVEHMEQLGPWYHSIDLGWAVTPGRSNVGAKFDLLSSFLPPLDGLRILDLGCNAGGIAVEFAKRGAQVTGVEASRTYFDQACWVRDQLNLNVEYHLMPVYGIGRLHTFDIVLFLGLIYHLRYPQLALDLVAERCEGLLFMNTPVIGTPETLMECRLQDVGQLLQKDESRHNWWFPSPTTLETMLTVAGFTDIGQIHKTETPFVSSTKSEVNESAFETGTVLYRASGAASGSTPDLSRP